MTAPAMLYSLLYNFHAGADKGFQKGGGRVWVNVNY